MEKINVFLIPDDIFVYFRADCVPDMVVKVLGNTKLKIQKEEDIPHALSKSKYYQNLECYLEKHKEDGLYLL